MADDFDALQKYAIPSAENNPAGDVPLHKMPGATGRPKRLMTAEEAAASLASRRQAAKDTGKSDGKERVSLKLAAMHAANPELAAKTVQPPDPVIPPFQWPNGLSNNPAVSDHGGMEPAALANSYPKKRGKHQTGVQQPSKEKVFLSRKTQLTMGMNGGIFKTPAITVRESEFSIVALIPVGDGSSAFIPGPGSELELGFDGKTVKAFYPGAYVEIPELGCGIMTFIKG